MCLLSNFATFKRFQVSIISNNSLSFFVFFSQWSVSTTLFSHVTSKKKGASWRGDCRKGWLNDLYKQGAFSRITRITWVQVLITRINNFMKYYRLYYFFKYNLRYVVFANICLHTVPGPFSTRTMQVFINSWVGDHH